jgi:hypothetical protein
LVKFIENRFLILFCDSESSIGNADSGKFAGLRALDGDSAVGGRKLHRIAQEVKQYLAKANGDASHTADQASIVGRTSIAVRSVSRSRSVGCRMDLLNDVCFCATCVHLCGK